MVFWYFRTMFLRLVDGGELELCQARSRCYTWLLVRSKANFNSDVSHPFTHAKRPPRQRLSSNRVIGNYSLVVPVARVMPPQLAAAVRLLADL
jgi:hypothetical protein